MTGKQLKRSVLTLLTLIMAVLLGSSLFSSLGEPQVTDRLELYQTDLLLHATELNQSTVGEADLSNAQKVLLGEQPIDTALKQYQTVRQSAEKNLNQFQTQLQSLSSSTSQTTTPFPPEVRQLQTAIQQQQDLINQLDLRIGVLQVEQNNSAAAIETWRALIDRAEASFNQPDLIDTTTVLIGLWSNPPRILPDAEPQLQKHLDGWFRYQALTHLYELQQRTDALAALQVAEQQVAEQTLLKLALVGVLPTLGGVIGFVLLIVLVAQWLLRRQTVLVETTAWEVPWDWETVLQVIVLGFFLIGQIVLPLLTQALGISFAMFGSRAKAIYTLSYYILMATSGLVILYLSIKPYFPLPEGWFRLRGKRNWFLWGLGGYFTALPLMLGVSLINQQIWQGQGGSNPLLQTVLEEGDTLALSIFFVTAAIAAPIFEEILFRGFLLPSLTKYVPVWAAIVLSSLLFAIAHLSLSEILPLTVLGMILGFAYTRSRSLLAPILLHSLWNSVTMLGLLILGSSS